MSPPLRGLKCDIVRQLRGYVYRLLTVERTDRGLARGFNFFLGGLILANVAAVVLETVEAIRLPMRTFFLVFEVLSVGIFSIEYALRIWSCTVNPRYADPVGGRIRYVLSPLALVDLLAIVPAFVPGGSLDLRFARAVRLLRLGRSLKIARYSRSLQTLGFVLKARRMELSVTAFAGLVLLICAASGIYYAEHAAQPDKFSSIPAAMWWGVITLTTVGYGDVYPVTTLGKVFASIIAVMGIGLFALPAGIVASGFAEEAKRHKAPYPKCPHCGRALNDE